MLPKGISDKGREEDRSNEVKKRDFMVLLLGYGYPDSALELRKKVSEILRKHGFSVYIMREIKSKRNEKLNAKFRRILRDYDPKLFLVLINQELGATGASYEVSLLVERHGEKKASQMIRMCVGKKIDLGKSFNEYVTELDEVVIRRYKDGNLDDLVEVMENTIIDAMT